VAPPTVSGRLNPEMIRREVARIEGAVRLCYVEGLERRADLRGNVAIRLVIGRDGALSDVTNGGSDLPDAEVIACTRRAFVGLAFPLPEGGIVTAIWRYGLSPK
jgi:hypothetical protein